MARSGPGRASPGQVRTAVWRSSLDLREQPWGVGDESKSESCSPYIATSCWAAKAWCPLAEQQATGGCARVGAPEWVRLSSARVQHGAISAGSLDSRSVVRRQAAPVLALVLGLIWFLD